MLPQDNSPQSPFKLGFSPVQPVLVSMGEFHYELLPLPRDQIAIGQDGEELGEVRLSEGHAPGE